MANKEGRITRQRQCKGSLRNVYNFPACWRSALLIPPISQADQCFRSGGEWCEQSKCLYPQKGGAKPEQTGL